MELSATVPVTVQATNLGTLAGLITHDLSRPSVQLQLWILLAATLAAVLTSAPLGRALRTAVRTSVRPRLPTTWWGRARRVARLFRALILPALLLLGFRLADLGLDAVDRAGGIVSSGTTGAALFGLYRLGSHAPLVVAPSRRLERYRRRLLLPALIVALLLLALSIAMPLEELLALRLGSLFESEITVGAVLLITVGLYFWTEGTLVVEDLVRRYLAERDGAGGALEVMIILGRYLGIVVGVAIALRLIGLTTTTLGFIWGGLSVGIGFGLRGILSNFVSGLILLFEQSVRPGDLIEVEGGTRAVVQRVNIRSTEVRTFAGAEVIIPNEMLLTSRVTNYSHSDRKVRLELEVDVAYDTDLRRAVELLQGVARTQAWVLRDPESRVLVRDFGDSGVRLALLAWVNDLDFLRRSDLALAVWEAFRREGIVMPFPQRDLHLRSGSFKGAAADEDGDRT